MTQNKDERYQLSCELEPKHQQDVKAILALPGSRLASASRDQSVGIWGRLEGNSGWELEALLGGHRAYVNSLAHIPSSEGGGDEEYIASGGNSSLILLHSLKTLSPESRHALIGHQLNVAALHYSPKRQKLISGSWDKTARIWARSSSTPEMDESGQREGGWSCEKVLEGHDEAVWGVMGIDEGPQAGGWLTASADRLIYLWNESGELLMRFKGSPEPVRSLCALSDGLGFASACNDGVVRKWDWTGSVTKLLKGHTDYVYQVVDGSEDHLISCGEDHTARIWNSETPDPETLLHPCQTVWSVTQCEDGDIATAGSDGYIRVWSKHPDRQASTETRNTYASKVEEGMRNYRGKQGAASNESTGQGQAGSITIDIDISDDAPPIPLTFDIGDDPRETAYDFGKLHNLSDNYINQIEQFIRAHIT